MLQVLFFQEQCLQQTDHEKMSPNLFDRMTKKPITYQSNPFSSHDADLNVKTYKSIKDY